MFWIKLNTLERKLADAFGYEYCTLFDTARSALHALAMEVVLPSNVCPFLRKLYPRAEIRAVRPDTGLSSAPFEMYGYRQGFRFSFFDVDPLMTGFLREPGAANSIISFGPKKMLDAGGGGALLSERPFEGKSYFPESLRQHITLLLADFPNHIRRQRDRIDLWDRYLGDSCIRIPQEQVMPWRVMRRIPEKRDLVVNTLRAMRQPVGTNYPPLPGVTDPDAISWGREVINFFPDSDPIGISEIVKRTLAQ